MIVLQVGGQVIKKIMTHANIVVLGIIRIGVIALKK
jgi:hypothetical protein